MGLKVNRCERTTHIFWEDKLGRISSLIELWIEGFSKLSWKSRIFNHFIGNKGALFLIAVLYIMCVYDCFTKKSFIDLSNDLRKLSTMTASMSSLSFFIWRKKEALAAIRNLKHLVSQLEDDMDTSTKSMLGYYVKFPYWVSTFIRIYAMFIWLGLTLPALRGIPAFPIQPPELLTVPVVRYTLLTLHIYALTCCCATIFTFYAFVVFGGFSLSGVFVCLGAHIRRSTRSLPHAIFLHQRLSGLSTELRDLLSFYTLMLLVGMLVTPILSSYKIIVFGSREMYLFVSLPMAFIVLLPMGLAGQELQTQTSDLAFDAYSSNWIHDRLQERKLTVILMMRCTKVASLRLSYFAPLNLPICQNILKSWFSYLNMLLNGNKRH